MVPARRQTPLGPKKNFKHYPKAIKIWLLIGVFMVFMQIVIGGITRLTGSGLSITKWEIVTGTLPPLNAQQWNEAFDLYKATPQYQKINEGMTMSEFRFIYFWEYFHRLWARLMGFVFAIPFLVFWSKGWIDRPLMRKLGVVILLAAVVASFGWIMVASGLIDRPWVNAYKLTMHLSLALVLYSYLFYTTLSVWQTQSKVFNNSVLKTGGSVLLALLAVQLILGGTMSGMKAALVYPTWPDLNGAFLPSVLLDDSQWTWENVVAYDRSAFMPALVQFSHRMLAYALFVMGLWYFFRGIGRPGSPAFQWGLWALLVTLTLQVVLGILTVINSVGTIPVDLGVYHQAGAILLLSAILYLNYQMRWRPLT